MNTADSDVLGPPEGVLTYVVVDGTQYHMRVPRDIFAKSCPQCAKVFQRIEDVFHDEDCGLANYVRLRIVPQHQQ